MISVDKLWVTSLNNGKILTVRDVDTRHSLTIFPIISVMINKTECTHGPMGKVFRMTVCYQPNGKHFMQRNKWPPKLPHLIIMA